MIEYIIVGTVYRSPNSNQEDNGKIIKLFDHIFASFKNRVVVSGDFNYPDIDWQKETCSKSDDHPATKFLDCIQQNYISQLNLEPTHYRGLQTPNILDLLFTNAEEIVSNLEHWPPLGKSHHSALYFEVQVRIKHSSGHSVKFQPDKGDFDGMRTYLREINWDDRLTSEVSVDETWKVIQDELIKSINIFVPKKKFKQGLSNSNKPRRDPIPQTLLDKIHLKRRAFKYFKRYPTIDNYKMYARARNQVVWESRKNVKEKEAKLAKESKNNPKGFFRYVASKTSSKEPVSNLIKEDGTLTQNDSEKACVLNNFFASVFTVEKDANVPNFSCNKSIPGISLVEVTIEQMVKALKNLNPSKSPGPDEIHPRILKELADIVAYPLKILFDRRLENGIIPSAWKEAEVRPIFKKGNKNMAGNYRPVSLTSIVCKVFEGFIRDALCQQLLDHDLLSKEQFGFTRGRSCVTQLLVTLQDWLGMLDEKIPVDAVYLDLKKAFDTVPHNRLINKLVGYGIQGKLLLWIKDFLNGRTQYVSVNGSISSKVGVSSGVPQGSVLGPTLFIYFINDMPGVVDCKVKVFADDTKAYSAIRNIEDRDGLQMCIHKLVDWTNTWLLEFNSDKCKVLHLGKNNPHYEYVIQENGLSRVLDSTTAEKDLGVTMDPELSFDTHINNIVKKGNQISGMIIRTITNKSPKVMVPLFKALVRPIIEYGNPVWCPYLKKHINKIEGVQRRFTKCIIGAKNLSYEERLILFNLPSLEFRRVRGDLIEVFKILHNMYDPCTTSSLFTMATYDKTRGHSLKLNKPNFETNRFRMFFTNRVINLWNNLSPETIDAKSVNTFKNHIDKTFRVHVFSTDLNLY